MAYTATGTTKGGRDGRAVLDDGARDLANATNRVCHFSLQQVSFRRPTA